MRGGADSGASSSPDTEAACTTPLSELTLLPLNRLGLYTYDAVGDVPLDDEPLDDVADDPDVGAVVEVLDELDEDALDDDPDPRESVR